MRSSESLHTSWRQHSHGNHGGGNCLEVTELPCQIAVRPSKDLVRPVLAFTHPE